MLACFYPLRTLSVRAADTNPFPTRRAHETRLLELLLIAGFLALLFGFGVVLSQALKASNIYPGPYALVYLGAWVPLVVAWNFLGYQCPN